MEPELGIFAETKMPKRGGMLPRRERKGVRVCLIRAHNIELTTKHAIQLPYHSYSRDAAPLINEFLRLLLNPHRSFLLILDVSVRAYILMNVHKRSLHEPRTKSPSRRYEERDLVEERRDSETQRILSHTQCSRKR
jgi:hypothetical protein